MQSFSSAMECALSINSHSWSQVLYAKTLSQCQQYLLLSSWMLSVYISLYYKYISWERELSEK